MKNYSLTLDTKKTIPHITVAEYGITFPSEACKLLNFASYIHVFYDDDSKVVAFKPCEKDEDAYSFYKPNVGTPGNVRWTPVVALETTLQNFSVWSRQSTV